MGQLLAERYQPLQRLKPGGTSTLWKALDTRTQQCVVLKFPSPPELPLAQERIQREALAYHKLGHVPGLVRFVGYEDNEGHELGPFLALEFLPGVTFNEHLLRHGTLSEARTIAVGRAVCKILDRLHTRGFVHRDLSLNNVFLLEGSNEVCLIDLGLALVPHPQQGFEAHETGKVGTPATRAPELSSAYSGDTRSDIYSLGKVLYQMANGVENSGQELQGLASEAKSRVSKALSGVIIRCVQTAQGARYQSVRELERALLLLGAKKVAIRTSQVCGALLLVGAVYAATATPSIEATKLNTPATQPATMAVQAPPKNPEPASTPTSEPIPEEKPQQDPPKTKKVKAPPLVTQTSNNDRDKPAESKEESLEDEDWYKQAREKALKIATEPKPLSKPKVTEIRVITEEKTKR